MASGAPLINQTYIQIGINGTVFNGNISDFVVDGPDIEMPYHNSDIASQFQVFLNNYFFESVAHAFFET